MPEGEEIVEGVAKEKIQKRIDQYRELLGSEGVDKTSPEYIYAADVLDEVVSLLESADDEHSFVTIKTIQDRIDAYEVYFEQLKEAYENKKKEKEAELEESSSASTEETKEDETSEEETTTSEESKTLEELQEEVNKIARMKIVPPTIEEIEAWKASKLKKAEKKKDKKPEEKDEDKKPQGLEEDKELAELLAQQRIVKSRIAELEEIDKDKELFQITEKGEFVVKYEDIKGKADKAALIAEYEDLTRDMLDKFYGNREKAKLYSEAISRIEGHKKAVEFEFVDADGKKQKGTYTTVEPYEGMKEDLKFTQLEEYVERLERLTRADAGDVSAYRDVKVRTGVDPETKAITYRQLTPEQAREQDELYIKTNNGAYNRSMMTYLNLKTLGKYGEKVPYFEMQEKQPVKNIVRGVGNALKFVRNHVTAPINKAIGTAVVAPVYGFVTGAKRNNVSGLYANKPTHRYVARRQYYSELYNAENPGHPFKNAIKARWSSIFKAKEGNKALLSAGSYDIQESLIAKYSQEAKQRAMREKVAEATERYEEQLAKLNQRMKTAVSDEERAAIQAKLDKLAQAKAIIDRDKQLNEEVATAKAAQSDTIDVRTHDIANKENVTRTITGFKILSRYGIRKFIGPKIEEWLKGHTTKTVGTEQKVNLPSDEELAKQLGVSKTTTIPAQYKDIEQEIFETRLNGDATMAEMLQARKGETITGYYSVWGGLAQPKEYTITGNEAITAIFERDKFGGHGLSDVAGLKAPGFTDSTFAQSFLDANGVLRQDITINEILEAMNKGAIQADELSQMYVSVGDVYWARLSDLCKGLTKEVSVGTETVKKLISPEKVITMTDEEFRLAVKGALDENPSIIEQYTTTVPVVVENTRATGALETLRRAGKIATGAIIADDVYENVRRTDSDVPHTKPLSRNYEDSGEFHGSKKADLAEAEKRKAKVVKKAERDRDEGR